MVKQVRWKKNNRKFWIRRKKNKKKAWQKKVRAGKILMLISPFGFIQMKIAIIYNVKLLFFFYFFLQLNCDCIGFAGPSNWFSSVFSCCRRICCFTSFNATLLTKCIENNYNSWRLTFCRGKKAKRQNNWSKWMREIKKKAPWSKQSVSEIYKKNNVMKS